MTEQLREFFYPLGFLAALAFGARMLLQWVKSEKIGKSVVTPTFWRISLVGNLLLMTHGLIQMQFHVCLIQASNAVISWRNLNIMLPDKRRVTTKQALSLLVIVVALTVAVFLLQGYFLFDGTAVWFRIPSTPWQSNADQSISYFWHLTGFFGLALFSSRFWVQWWSVETTQVSQLGKSFWWCSLIGESLCLGYFLRIGDPVNFIGPAFGLIPYFRNLALLYKKRTLSKESFKV